MPQPTTALVPMTTVTFPEIALRTRDAHKLRGYFGELFREHSPLLHNHLDADETDVPGEEIGEKTAVKFRYAYPLVQYKVLGNPASRGRTVPTLVGLGEGAGLLTQLFLQIHEITLEQDGVDETYPVQSKHIRHEHVPIGMADDLIEYRFETLWMALNQDNHRDYRRYSEADRQGQLKRVLTSQLLALFREFGIWLQPHERIMMRLDLREKSTQFKNQTMVAFTGGFLANVVLPNGLGIGKSVSRGFGVVMNDER